MPRSRSPHTERILDMFAGGKNYKEIATTDPNWSYHYVKDIVRAHRRGGDPRAQRWITRHGRPRKEQNND